MARKKKSNDPLKSKKEWTVSEFQMWLGGAFSLQGDDWVPNEEQWEMIVDIVYKLKSNEVEVPVLSPAPYVARPPVGGFAVPPMPLVDPMLESNDGNPNPPFDPDNIPDEAKLSLDELRNMSQHGTGTVSSGKRIKTPNIDTSTGYKSSFE